MSVSPPMLILSLLAVACSEPRRACAGLAQCSDASVPGLERSARPLIGPFDFSKKFRGRRPTAQEGTGVAQEERTQAGPPRAAARAHPLNESSGGPELATGTGASAAGARPARRAVVLEGDVVLGGLISVHERARGGACGRVSVREGVQALEALLFALDAAQVRALAPPGVRLGALLLDDCGDDALALDMALDFIKGSVGNIADAEYSCRAAAAHPRNVVAGVLGAASSLTSVRVANLLRLFKIPQVSFYSTSPELSNKARFEYFARTVPSDAQQARAIAAIVRELGWRYVSVLHDDSDAGIKAFEELETLLARNDVCIAVKERLSAEPDDAAFDATVARMLARPRARGVIVLAQERGAAALMEAVSRAGAADVFGWVGSGGWSARPLVSEGREHVVEGAIAVQPQARPLPGFTEYFLNLTVENNARNPWFRRTRADGCLHSNTVAHTVLTAPVQGIWCATEFWETQFQCRYPGSAGTGGRHARVCSTARRLAPGDLAPDPRLQLVADAVFAFAHALRNMHAELCGGEPGLCHAMRPPSGPALLRHLRRVRFTGLGGDEFRFDDNGDGPARYDVMHYKRVAAGRLRWVRVGRYLHGELQLRLDDIQFRQGRTRPPPSVCSAECGAGQARQYVEGERCCWHCFNCSQHEVVSAHSETACSECEPGTVPDVTRRRCLPVPERYARADGPAGGAALCLAALGLVLTGSVAATWVARGQTPVVRASGRELSFVLLGGIAMCYLVTFALLSRPTEPLCALQRGGAGLCFTVVYAALLTKTDRIARIFAAGCVSAQRPALISPRSQLFICAALVSVQALAVLCWQAARPARAVRHHVTREDNVLVCDCHVDAYAAAGFLYPALLVAVCTALAVRTRNIPGAFNESKHIGFTMYTTCVIWLAFVPLYLGTAHRLPLRVAGLALTIALSASVTLLCLFAPKMYIIVVRPERNVRGRVLPARWSGGAVCAALVCAAPCAERPRPGPGTRVHAHVQTDETPLVLDARRLPMSLLTDH